MQVVDFDPSSSAPLSRPLVGEKAVACSGLTGPDEGPRWVVYALLGRPDLTELWSGQFLGRPVTWLDADHLLVARDRDLGIWNPPKKRVEWRAPLTSLVWNGRVVVFPHPDEMEVRDTLTGATVQRVSFDTEMRGYGQIAGDTLLCYGDDEVVAIDLPSGKKVWTLSLSKELGAPVKRHLNFLAVFPTSGNRAVLKRGGSTGLVDLSTGRVRWKKQVPTMNLPLVSGGRVAYFFNGHLVVLDERSGRTVASVERAAFTIRESRPCAFGEWMVVVNENGHIVTVDLASGKVLGVQRQNAYFFSCVGVDGRLLVASDDRQLWVYEPTGSGTDMAVRSSARRKKDSRTGRTKAERRPSARRKRK
jgi:hypothetical protein